MTFWKLPKTARPLRLFTLIIAFVVATGLLANHFETHAAGLISLTSARARGYIIRFVDGKPVCMAATSAEAENMLSRAKQGPALHRISDFTSSDVATAGVPQTGLNIILRGTTQLEGFPDAKAAFIRAAANWQALIQTPITVVVDVDYGPTGFGQKFDTGVIGQTDSQEIPNPSGYVPIRAALNGNFSNANESTLYGALPPTIVPTDTGNTTLVWATSANLRALGLMNPVANPDGEPSGAWGTPPAVAFNSAFQYDFDPSDGIDPTKTDFDAVATHEIGHALGFTSEVGDVELTPTDGPSVSVWDMFRFRPGTTVGTFGTATRIQHSGGTQVFFSGMSELGLSTGRPDGTGGDRAQASHWKAQNPPLAPIGIMDPFIGAGQRQTITNNDLLALNMMGYRLTAEPPARYASAPTGAKIDLTSGVAQTASIPASSDPNICSTLDTQFKIQVPVGSSQLLVNLSGNQDVDLHARAGLRFVSSPGWPGVSDYTSNSPNSTESITITPSSNLPLQPGAYYFAVDNCGGSAANITLTATVTAPTNQNAIDDTTYFVTQQYADFLSRLPDQGGLDFWTQQINNCGSDSICLGLRRIAVADAFFFEPEYQQTGSYVFRLYRESFGNSQPIPNSIPDSTHPGEENKLPSYAVFGPDRAQVVGGTSLAQSQLDFATAFATRPEFIARYPLSLDGPGFVDAVLATVLNDDRVDLSSQRTGLIALFNQGGRGMVIYKLADDNVDTNPINNRAFIDAEYSRAFVATEYFGYLRRDADMAGFLFWLGQINSAPLRDVDKQHAMVCSFITSQEYQFRFGTVASHSNVECPR